MKRRGWELYTPGQEVGGAHVAEITVEASHMAGTVYDVKWLCCGRESEQTHAQLNKRARNGLVLCWHCARQAKGPVRATAEEADPQDQMIEIPLPGINGRWRPLGRLGARYSHRDRSHSE